MMRTFKILSLLLGYPGPDLFAHLADLSPALAAEGLLPAAARQALAGVIDELAAMPPLDAEERYVGLFDRNRSLSLHLYEHIHGESRDRGEAMVRLAELYRLHGLEIGAQELPDYLPLFLEFLSLLPLTAARSLLRETLPVLTALAEKLTERRSIYAEVLGALCALAEGAADPEAVRDIKDSLPAEADTLEALDRQWEEESVRFTAAAAPNTLANNTCGEAR